MSPTGWQLRNYKEQERHEGVTHFAPSRNRQEVAMLVLSRKLSQRILVGSDISITVVKIDRNHVRIGITAPPGVAILREELLGRGREPEVRPSGLAGRQPVAR
jgi:carbon storage regulator